MDSFKTFKSEKLLLAQLKNDIEQTPKKRIVIQAGHFPLVFNHESKRLEEGVSRWNGFTLTTFEWGCELANFSLKLGKSVKIWIICDDHSYQPEYDAIRSAKQLPLWNAERNRFFKSKSTAAAELAFEFEQTLQEFGFTRKIVERHDQQKPGRRSCLYFSEKALRKNGSRNNEIKACTDEYVALLDKHFDKKNAFLVSFVPFRCMHSIQDALLLFERDIACSHAFMKTGVPKKRIFSEDGIYYYRQQQ